LLEQWKRGGAFTAGDKGTDTAGGTLNVISMCECCRSWTGRILSW
jgi:hypothetical protein